MGLGTLTGIGHRADELIRLGDFTPLAAEQALEVRPALSPDGRKLAYVRADRGHPPQLLLKDLRSGSSAVLDGHVLDSTSARWSPDGKRVAYFAPAGDGIALRIREPGSAVREAAVLRGAGRQSGEMNALLLDWIDNDSIAYSDRTGQEPLRLTSLDLRTGARGNLTDPPRNAAGDVQPAVKGGFLAFARYTSQSEGDVYVKDLQTNTERRITHDNARLDGIAWHRGALVIASMRSRHSVGLYQVQMNGTISKLSTGEGFLQYPQIAGDDLVVQRHLRDSNIWMFDGNLSPVSPSTAFEGTPAIRPDGTEIAFVSKRSGPTEIWAMPLPAGEPEQLTHLGQTFTDCPRWSPDGRLLAFTSHRDGNRDIYLVQRNTKTIHRLTSALSEEGRASWSRDGSSLYYRSDRSGTAQIWKQSLAGEPFQLTRKGGFEGFESLDGRRFYFLKDRHGDELWSMPSEGGPERLEYRGIRESRWSITLKGILFLRDTAIWRWRPGTQTAARMFQIPPPIALEAGFHSDLPANRLAWVQVDKLEADILHTKLTAEDR